MDWMNEMIEEIARGLGKTYTTKIINCTNIEIVFFGPEHSKFYMIYKSSGFKDSFFLNLVIV